jgi:hypothetical protein
MPTGSELAASPLGLRGAVVATSAFSIGFLSHRSHSALTLARGKCSMKTSPEMGATPEGPCRTRSPTSC